MNNNVLEINKKASGKYDLSDGTSKPVSTCIDKDVELFRSLLKTNEACTKAFTQTESSKEFFKAVPLITDYLKEANKTAVMEDMFYSTKLGFFYEGVPSKLVFLLKKSLFKYKTPNAALAAIYPMSIQNFLKKGALPEGITIKTIMEACLSREIELLSSFKRKVIYDNLCEIYVANTNRVLVAPEEMMRELTSRSDLEAVEFVENIGVCVRSKPLRTFGGKIGIVTDEYDLRGCI